jgi:deaminated glutathione amidase
VASGKFNVAAVQMVSSAHVQDNLYYAEQGIARAASQGAQLVLLPEYFAFMGFCESDKIKIAESLGQGPIQSFLAEMALKHKLWIVGGTLPLLATQPNKVRNTTLVYNPQGQQVARYDKIHLFCFFGDQEHYNEAKTIEPGETVQVFDAADLRIGLSVCYDLRFPELYRAMQTKSQPVDLIVVPAAFTYTTGRAHWEVLLRARAIENQCYVLACGQGGDHENGRRTYGHSMWIDPWGQVLSCLPEAEGVLLGQFDRSCLKSIRQQLPALHHRTSSL